MTAKRVRHDEGKMKNTKGKAIGLALAGALGVSCAAPTGTAEIQGAPASSVSAEITPPGFEDWLSEQCPDGATVVLEHPETGEQVHFMACEDVREKAAADAYVRARIVEAYAAERGASERGEPLGAAREPLTPLGALACAIIGAGPGFVFAWPGRGCERATTPENRTACEDAIGGFTTASLLLCGIAAFF
jgi:hypothetical protein